MPWLWAVIASQTVIAIVGSLILPADLIAERMKPKGRDEDALGVPVLTVLCLAQLIIAVLDTSKWHISDSVPYAVQLVALCLQALGWIGLYWSMYVNKYFSSAIRMQEDRGHTIITDGPYKFVRHPGYAFATMGFLSVSLALGSWLSILPAFGLVGWMAYRTLLEEKMLRENLPGYVEYTQQTKYRWLPGVW